LKLLEKKHLRQHQQGILDRLGDNYRQNCTQVKLAEWSSCVLTFRRSQWRRRKTTLGDPWTGGRRIGLD